MDPSDFAPVNLGQILGNVEQIKAAQQARQISQFKMEQARQAQEQQARLGQLLPQAAAGDSGAMSEVASIDPELWMKLDDHQKAKAASHIEDLGAAVAWADTPEKWDQAVSYLSKDNPELAQYAGHFEMRPQAAMQLGAMKQFIASQAKAGDAFTLGPGQQRYGPDGRVIAESPFKPEILKDDQGNIWQFNGGNTGAPRGIRNNNAGNIEDGPFAQSLPGYAGSDGRFAKFNSPQAGDAARMRLLGSYISRGFDTPAKIIGRWSPASENGASTSNYINFVASKLGVGPNDRVSPAQIPQLAAAIAAFENGSAGPSKGPSGGPQLIVAGAGKPQYQLVSEQERAQLGLPPGKYQRAPDGEIKPVGGTANQGVSRQQLGLAKMKIGNLRGIENQLNRVEMNMKAAEDNGWTGPVSGLVPGRFDKESDTFDKSVRLLANLVRQLTRVPGEGAMSDYESKLAEMTLPSRTDTPEGRREALTGIRELIGQIRSGYEDMIGVSDTRAGSSNAPDPLGIR